MTHRIIALAVAASLFGTLAPPAARADNAMGYQLLTPQEAAGLPHNNGGLGLDVERSQVLTSGGMTFDIMRVKGVKRYSPGEQAGFKPGDQVIAVDGRVFPSLATFAAYVGSLSPGTQIAVDYIPGGGGPGQAQRVGVTIAPRPGAPPPTPQPGGLSTGTKVAIGVGAAALIGCYELGCFSRKPAARVQASQYPQQTQGQAQPYQGQPGTQQANPFRP